MGLIGFRRNAFGPMGWLKWKERHDGENLGVPPLSEAGRLSFDLEFCVRR